MADDTLTEPGLIGGIIMPRIQNRWRFNSISILTPEENNLITYMLVANHFEYNANTAFNSRFGLNNESHRLLLVLEDPVLTHKMHLMEPIVQKLCDADKPFDIIIDTPGWTNNNIDLIERRATYYGCKLTRYTYTQDYAASEACRYPIEFSVGSVRYSNPDLDKFIAAATKK